MFRTLILLICAHGVAALPVKADTALDVAAADAHACALYESGKVYCWGDFPGEYPELPFAAWEVTGLPEARAISAGSYGACAIDTGNKLWCWGFDVRASAEQNRAPFSLRPFRIEGLKPVSDIAMGYGHLCAIAGAAGEIWCWGDNSCGELGCGDTEPRSAPTRVPSLRGASAISAGVNNTCVVLRNGRLACWGSDNPTMPYLAPFIYDTPEPLIFDPAAVSDLAAVANGRNFACGLRVDGRVTCWGSNILGQLGTSAPRLGSEMGGIAEVEGVEAAQDIDASYFEACAVAAGDVACWGKRDPANFPWEPDPLTKLQFGTASRVGVGSLFSCAVVGRRVRCWGPEGVEGHVLIPGMTVETAVAVPGLPGETSAQDVQRRLFVSREEIGRLVVDGRFDTALDLITRLRSDFGDDAELDELEIDARFEAGQSASDASDLVAAFGHYTRAIELSGGTHTASLNNRALIFGRRGDFAAAIADIDLALLQDPERSLYHANKCLLLRLSGDLDAALAECEIAVARGVGADSEALVWGRLQRGLVRRVSGDIEGAIADFVATVENARETAVARIQATMTAADLYSGAVDGLPNAELANAISQCVESDECFEQASSEMSDLLDLSD